VPEEETLLKMEEKNAGAKPEVTSHYVPTARGRESISRRIVSHYQRMHSRSLLNFIDGRYVNGKKMEWHELGQNSDSADNEWIIKHRPKCLLYSQVRKHNYYAPLASQVEELDRHITFALPPNHTDKNSANWRQKEICRIKDQRLSVLDGSIPSAISNTGTTASAFTQSDPTIATEIWSTATFSRAFGNQARATTVNKLHHKIRKPACSIHIVLKKQQTLLSTSKLVEADYVAIYNKQEVNF
jgi:hypothetical protein